jgi:hypothetical protein
MAYFYGYQGSVKFHATGGTTTSVVNITEWNLTVDKQIIETTQITDVYAKKVGGLISGSGSLTLIYTTANNSFIEAVNTTSDPGTALFELYLSETDTKKISFNGVISKASYSATRDDVQTMSCDFVTNGAITMDL